MADEPLKQKNLPRIGTFLVGYGAVLAWFYFGMPSLSDAARAATPADWLRAAGVTAAPLVAIPINWLAGSSLKAILVFWRHKHVLPSHRFMELALKDPRVNLERLRSGNGGTLPVSADAQTRLWNQFYRRHEADPAVRSNHQDYLLLREMTWLSVLMGVIGTLVLGIRWYMGAPMWIYLTFAVATYVFLSHSGRNAGNRFAMTVVAIESTEGSSENGIFIP